MDSRTVMPETETLEQTLAAETASASLDPALQRVLQRVRLLARRRVAWLRHLWSEEIRMPTQAGVVAVNHAEVDALLEGRDVPEAEMAWVARQGVAGLETLPALESAMAADTQSRWAVLHRMFGLDESDSDLLQVCVALALDPSLARVYAYLHDHAGRPYATEELAARLTGRGACGTWNADSPLFRWELLVRKDVAPGEPVLLACDPMIRNWLLGHSGLDEVLVDAARLQPVIPALPHWPVQEAADRIAHLAGPEGTARVRVRVSGLAGSGRKSLAGAVAARLGLPLLLLDADAVPESQWTRFFVHAQRQAFLDRTALAWQGECLTQRVWPSVVPGFPVQFMMVEPAFPVPPFGNSVDVDIMMPELSSEERQGLWQRHLPASATWPSEQLRELAMRFRLTVGDLAAVAAQQPVSGADAGRMIRQQARQRLGKLAQHLECPFTLEDLVVAEPLRRGLDDLIYEAQVRTAFWERPAARRLFPQGRGLLALFSGPSGTGKTMAAQVMAASLGLDLFRIDLSAVVSKYVGETSQNLERILARAAGMDVVLFFDEADALFGKRTEIKDAHDRFANTDTNYLLQAIENYEGVAVLATNQKAQLDAAFIRRIRCILEFNRPDPAQRLEIWRRVVRELGGDDVQHKLDAGLQTVARDMEATGAQIKNAVLSALFAAQRQQHPLALEHILLGLEREWMKEGKAFSERERGRILGA